MYLVNGVVVGAGAFVVDGHPQVLAEWVKEHEKGDFIISMFTGKIFEFTEEPNLFTIAYLPLSEEGKEQEGFENPHVGSIIAISAATVVQNVVRVIHM